MKVKMKTREFSLVLAMAGLLVGCSNGLSRFEARRVSIAPQDSHAVGVLAFGARTEDLTSLLANHKEARFRVLSHKEQFYEIYGVPAREIQGHLPSARISPSWL